MGDITPAEATKATNWLAQFALEPDTETRIRHAVSVFNQAVGGHTIPTPTKNTHKQALALCDAWDQNDPGQPNQRPALCGYLMARSMIQNTHIIPSPIQDFSGELRQMQAEHADDAAFLANNALGAMAQSHPRLYRVYVALQDLGDDIFRIQGEDALAARDAGMTLPYTFAAASRLIGYTPRFTGMRKNPDSSQPFSKTLVDSVPLATRRNRGGR